MAVSADDMKLVEGILVPGEEPIISVMQRRVGPGGSVTTPTTVVATDKRVIIINRASLGIRKDYEAIPYKQIASVRLEHGLISSSVFIRVEGYDQDKGLLKSGREEGEIDGLRNKDAKDLSDEINRRILSVPDSGDDAPAGTGSVFCTKCGARNAQGANFCAKCGQQLKG
ncbi:MAG TPA: PH domain-containing protein [Candidatus Acidoferrales bacterium]|nr:PH domain-containing protein [Candidatus Acidoferrales bacterium]